MFNPFKYRSRMQARKDSLYVLNIKRLLRGEQFNSPMNNLEKEVRAEAVQDFLLHEHLKGGPNDK